MFARDPADPERLVSQELDDAEVIELIEASPHRMPMAAATHTRPRNRPGVSPRRAPAS